MLLAALALSLLSVVRAVRTFVQETLRCVEGGLEAYRSCITLVREVWCCLACLFSVVAVLLSVWKIHQFFYPDETIADTVRNIFE